MWKAVILLALFLATSGCYLIPNTPEAAFHEFQTTQHKESYIVLPLCVAGESVVPLVIEKVKQKDLDRRRYAIAFLGTSEGDLPVTVLESIANDVSEEEYFRGNALESLFVLSEKKGKALALTFKYRADFLGTIAKEISVVSNHLQFRQEYRRIICEPND